MPWSETSAMDQKARFIRDWIAGHWSVTELCCRYGVSRKTGYKWAERFALQGPDGLLDQGHAPRHSPHRTPEATEHALLAVRLKHPRWGAKKLLIKAAKQWPEMVFPHRSTRNLPRQADISKVEHLAGWLRYSVGVMPLRASCSRCSL